MFKLFLNLLQFKILFAYCFILSSNPHASITAWTPGSYGNYQGVSYKKPALPIWVRIAFDQKITDDFATNFFRILNGSRPTKHGKFRDEFVITVPASTTRETFEASIDKTNRYFDPEIERREKLAIQQEKERVEKETAARAAVELRQKADAETALLQREIDEKKRIDAQVAANDRLASKKGSEEKPIAQVDTEHKQKTSGKTLKKESDKASRQAQRSAAMSQLTPQEKLEYSQLMQDCSAITERFTAMDGQRSSAFGGEIFKYLKNSGSRAALPALIDQIEAGRVQEHYLNAYKK